MFDNHVFLVGREVGPHNVAAHAVIVLVSEHIDGVAAFSPKSINTTRHGSLLFGYQDNDDRGEKEIGDAEIPVTDMDPVHAVSAFIAVGASDDAHVSRSLSFHWIGLLTAVLCHSF